MANSDAISDILGVIDDLFGTTWTFLGTVRTFLDGILGLLVNDWNLPGVIKDHLRVVWAKVLVFWDQIINHWNLPGVLRDRLRVVWANVIVFWDLVVIDWDLPGVIRDRLSVVWANAVDFWDQTVNDWVISGVIRDRLPVSWANVAVLRDQLSWDHIGRMPKYALIGAGVGAIGLPLLICTIPFVWGFRKKGIYRRSVGSKMMSRYGGHTPSGGHVARMQTIGTKGFPNGFFRYVIVAGAVLGAGLGISLAHLLNVAEIYF